MELIIKRQILNDKLNIVSKAFLDFNTTWIPRLPSFIEDAKDWIGIIFSKKSLANEK